MTIKLSQSNIGIEEINLVSQVMQKKYLGMGTYTETFEKKIKSYLATNNSVVCVNTGTSALELVGDYFASFHTGKNIIVPSLTYVACCQAFANSGFKIRLADVDATTLTLSPESIENARDADSVAVMLMHYGGRCDNLSEIKNYCDLNSLVLIQDCAHSFGSKIDGNTTGSQPGIYCFSFDGIKNITCGEGGAIVTDNSSLASFCRSSRLLGIVRDTEQRYAGKRSWTPKELVKGHRFHLQNMNAAIGIVQLERISKFKDIKLKLHEAYFQLLKKVEEVKLVHAPDNNYHLHVLVAIVRNKYKLREFLSSRSIETGLHYFPNHMTDRFFSDRQFPATDELYHKIISLPFHTNLTLEQVNYVCKSISEFYNG